MSMSVAREGTLSSRNCTDSWYVHTNMVFATVSKTGTHEIQAVHETVSTVSTVQSVYVHVSTVDWQHGDLLDRILQHYQYYHIVGNLLSIDPRSGNVPLSCQNANCSYRYDYLTLSICRQAVLGLTVPFRKVLFSQIDCRFS